MHDIFTQAEEYLSEKYDIRYNEISNDFEYKNKKNSTYRQLNDSQIYIELQKSGIKISQNNLIALLKSDYVTRRYNPFLEYFNSLPEWDKKTDYINQLTSFVDAEEKEAFQMQFKKWIVRAAGTATIEGYVNKQCFTLVGGQNREQNQNTGKTTFCRFLVPEKLKSYLKDNLGTDKDSRVDLTRNLLVNLDELESLAKRDVNTLKSLFSVHQINDRLPYDRKNSIMKRTASFIGSTNLPEFLVDETGSVRWLCFRVNGINWHYKQKINMDLVWSQAFSLLHSVDFKEQMNQNEIKENESRNKQYQQTTPEIELLSKYFAPATKGGKDAFFLQSTELVSRITPYVSGVKLNKIMMGRACAALGIERVKSKGVYGYWVRPKNQNMLSLLKDVETAFKY